ncbi:MAG: hypothetical protein U9R68_00985, partial [Planctomycetota bacterium]|nr:hypothetical protein [Planctomycetota bacterium]
TKAQQLLASDPLPLVLTLAQGGGAANKIVTVANVMFTGIREAMTNGPFFGYTLDYIVANSSASPLSLDGDNKIITIADPA